MRKSAIVVSSVIIAIVLTLITGLVNTTPKGLVGAVWYGYPATWIRKLVIAPQYYPWRMDYTGMAIDLVVWFAVAAAILLIASCATRKSGRKNRPGRGAVKQRNKPVQA